MNAQVHSHRPTSTAQPGPAADSPPIGLVAGVAGVVGPALFTAGWIMGGSLTPGYSHVREPISQIAASGAPLAWLQQAAFVVLGISVAVLAVGLHRTVRGGPWHAALGPALLGAAAAGVILTAAFQDDPTGTVQQSMSSVLHRATGATFFLALIGAAVAFRWRLRRDPAWRGLARFSWLSGVVSFGLFVAYGVAISAQHPLTGLAQRGLAVSLLAWVVVLALRLLAVTADGASSRPSLTVKLQGFFARHVTRSRPHAFLYELTGGRLGSRMPMVAPGVLLLTTTGHRSGRERTTPLVGFRDGDRYLIAATNNGTGRTPAWLRNLRELPKARVRDGRKVVEATAAEAAGDERDRLWRRMTEEHPLFAEYERQAPRPIPVIVLDPHSD